MKANDFRDVVIVGAAITDLQIRPVTTDIARQASWPAEQMVWTTGGDALNEATILTRLGHSVRLISCTGTDAPARMILDHCARNGIDTSWIRQDPAKTTAINVGLIWEDGERTFINNRNGSLWTFGPEDVDLSAVSDARILSFASFFNTPRLDRSFLLPLFRQARDQGMIICADMVASKRGETLEDLRDVLPLVDFFFPNYPEASALTGKSDPGEIADALHGLGVKNVILKIGSRGCLVRNADSRFVVPAYPHAACIDTTGAGDNFASGFLCGLLEGMSLRECAQMANCTASIAIEHVGATTGVTDRTLLDARYRDYLRALSE